MNDHLLHEVALNRLPGIGHAAAKHLISYLGPAEQIFATRKSGLLKVPGIGEKLTAEILSKSSYREAETILRDCEKNGINIHHFTQESFPEQLKSIYDAPTLIYTQGDLTHLRERSIAIVGTRKATPYGREITRKIVSDLMNLNVTVISGLAYGIDIEAHRQAIKSGLSTYGVLASGLDLIYPQQHWKTAQEMLEKGGLISENPPGTKPDARLFPARNRIIAGLADATLVVEAADKGGALITANIANSYNKPVFAVPGNLGLTYSTGTNMLLSQQKALVYTSTADLSHHLNWETSLDEKRTDLSVYDLSPEERAVLQAIESQQGGLPIDEISWKTQIQVNQLASLLLSLEFSGLVKSLPGKKYSITYLR